MLWAPDGTRIAWSYSDLWERSVEVAKALIANGRRQGRADRRADDQSARIPCRVFGDRAWRAASRWRSARSRPPSELEYLLRAGAVSILLYERQVLKKDFGAMLVELEPLIATAGPGALVSAKFPYPVAAGGPRHGDERAEPAAADARRSIPGSAFLAQAREVPDALVDARADGGPSGVTRGRSSSPRAPRAFPRASSTRSARWRCSGGDGRGLRHRPGAFPVRAGPGTGSSGPAMSRWSSAMPLPPAAPSCCSRCSTPTKRSS